MVAERLEGFEGFEEFVALVELELLAHSVGILETMKNCGGLSIQCYMCWSMGCNLMVFSLHLWHWLNLSMNHGHGVPLI